MLRPSPTSMIFFLQRKLLLIINTTTLSKELERQKNESTKAEILMQNAMDFRAKLEQKISDLEKHNEDKDAQVRQAQQHLAKKVKETAIIPREV